MFENTATLAALLFALWMRAPAADDAIITDIAAQRLAEILAQEGYGVAATHVAGDDSVIHVKMNGNSVLLVLGDSGTTLQACAAFGGTAANWRNINLWNKSKRFSRAYLDDEGDPVLESDINLEGGVTERAIAKFLKVYSISMAAFEQEVCRPQVAPQLTGDLDQGPVQGR